MHLSFDRFLEVSSNSIKVGVSSYLFYTLFKCFVMFVLIEAVRGRLIGPTYWNQSVKIFRPICAARSSFRDCFGCLSDDLLNKSCIG